jgi:hypothetical protein
MDREVEVLKSVMKSSTCVLCYVRGKVTIEGGCKKLKWQLNLGPACKNSQLVFKFLGSFFMKMNETVCGDFVFESVE